MPLPLPLPLSLREELHFLSDHSSYQRHLNQLLVCPPFLFLLFVYFLFLKVGIDRIFNGVKLKNSEAMEVILKAAIETAISKDTSL